MRRRPHWAGLLLGPGFAVAAALGFLVTVKSGHSRSVQYMLDNRYQAEPYHHDYDHRHERLHPRSREEFQTKLAQACLRRYMLASLPQLSCPASTLVHLDCFILLLAYLSGHSRGRLPTSISLPARTKALLGVAYYPVEASYPPGTALLPRSRARYKRNATLHFDLPRCNEAKHHAVAPTYPL